MRLDIFTPAPHDQARRPARRPPPPAILCSSPLGTFYFNKVAVALLELTEPRTQVRLGHERNNPQAWVVQVCEPGEGWPILPVKGSWGFRSRFMREQLVASLPFASAGKAILLHFDPLSCLTQAGEAWQLDTAPYCRPPAPAAAEPMARALRLTLPPELRAQMARGR